MEFHQQLLHPLFLKQNGCFFKFTVQGVRVLTILIIPRYLAVSQDLILFVFHVLCNLHIKGHCNINYNTFVLHQCKTTHLAALAQFD